MEECEEIININPPHYLFQDNEIKEEYELNEETNNSHDPYFNEESNAEIQDDFKEEPEYIFETEDICEVKLEIQQEEFKLSDYTPKDSPKTEVSESTTAAKCSSPVLVKSVAKSKLFQCLQCKKVLKNRKSLNTHKKIHSNETFKCTKCSYKSNVKRYLKAHESSHSKGSNETKVPDQSGHNQEKMVPSSQTQDKEKKSENIPVKRFKCVKCKYETHLIRYLRAHMNTTHSEFIYKCSVCSHKTKRKDALRKHERIHLIRNKENQSEPRMYKCPDCEYVANKTLDLKVHRKTAHPRSNHKCTVCDYETSRKDNLRKHALIHLNFKLFKCSQCNYGTNNKYSLEVHELSHTDTKRLKCEKCGYATNCRNGLRQHMLTHLGEKIFKCPHCDYRTNFKNNFTLHVRVHSSVKLLKCSLCEYETNFKQSMKIHSLNHSSYRRFRCEQCDYGTNIKSCLKQHMLSHSKEHRFRCQSCPYKTNFKGNLLNHEKIHAKKSQSEGMSGIPS